MTPLPATEVGYISSPFSILSSSAYPWLLNNVLLSDSVYISKNPCIFTFFLSASVELINPTVPPFTGLSLIILTPILFPPLFKPEIEPSFLPRCIETLPRPISISLVSRPLFISSIPVEALATYMYVVGSILVFFTLSR